MAESPENNPVPVEAVSAEIIRHHFNSGQYVQQAQSGQLLTVMSRNGHPDKLPEGEPLCTRSQIIRYYTPSMELVAVVHQYRRADGTLGRSGLQDPKWLRLSDKIVYVPTKTGRE